MFKVNKDSETGRIKTLQLSDVVFSYSYLVSPRPESDFNAGTYGTELIIRDPAQVTAIKDYLQQVMDEAKTATWEGKLPKNLNIPIRAGNEDSELEAGAFVLKTASKQQPKLFIRMGDETRAHEVTEEEIDEIYAGMIGEAIVTFRAYTYNGIKGIKCYINAVCKTANGKPLSGKVSYEESFSIETDFDAPVETPKAKTGTKANTKVEEAEETINLDAMLSSHTKSSKTEVKDVTTTQSASKTKARQPQVEAQALTIDDLLSS